MPMQRHLYPDDWEAIRAAIRARAEGRCEWPDCGRANGETVTGLRGQSYRVVLTVAHLDHNPANCAPDNLRAWCQVHHLRYDAQQHAETRKKKRADAQLLAAKPPTPRE